jgi:hypothetical protein
MTADDMHRLEVPLTLIPFFGGAVVGMLLSRRVQSRWWAAAVGFIASCGFVVLLLGAPLRSWKSEVLIAVAGAVALVPTFVAYGNSYLGRKQGDWVALLVVPMILAVFMPLSVRLTYASRVLWSCDGMIVQKYRSTNHNARTLHVRNVDGGEARLEGVDQRLWADARIGGDLRKFAPSAFGELDGRAMRVVPRTMGWRREPGRPPDPSP